MSVQPQLNPQPLPEKQNTLTPTTRQETIENSQQADIAHLADILRQQHDCQTGSSEIYWINTDKESESEYIGSPSFIPAKISN